MIASSRLQFTFQACADLNGVWETIAMPDDRFGSANTDPLAAAGGFVDQFEQACQLLTLHPEMGSPRHELQDGIRSLLFQRYVLFYRTRGNCVEIMRIIRAAREVDAVV
jgi:plasmid stabilization system protein ParE